MTNTAAFNVQALVLAAGRGSHMPGAFAKVLHLALGVPLLEHVLRAASGAGADNLLVAVSRQDADVESAFAGRGLEFVYQDPPLGPASALQAAQPLLARQASRTLLVLNGDLPLLRASTLGSLLETHRRSGAVATLLSARLAAPGAYDRVLRDPDGSVRGIAEVRDASPEQRAILEISAGVYAFEVDALLAALPGLLLPDARCESYPTNVIGLLAAAGHMVCALDAADAREAQGVDSPAELAQANRLLRERRVEELLATGVFIEDPASTWVGLDAQLEPAAVLRPFTVVEGRSVVRSRACVGPFSRLVDTDVGPGALILDHCLLREAVVEAGAQVGPFAHVRPESVIGRDARVGNFVELKKSRLGEGAKASHLSYLGDASIGPGVNIGAGTITCNYDGTHKHATRIEAGAFIGSDTTLVAPVTIGEGAYVGAGSTITEDVPPGALALGRARQVVRPDWAIKRRAAQRKGKL